MSFSTLSNTPPGGAPRTASPRTASPPGAAPLPSGHPTGRVPKLLLHSVPDLAGAHPRNSVTSTIARFREIAAAIGDRPALVSAGRSCTFAEAVERADAIGAAFRRKWESAPDDRSIAVLAEQSVDSLLVILGAMASGRTVVIADPLLPADRLADMFRRAKVAVCVTDQERRPLGEQIKAVTDPSAADAPSLVLTADLLAAPPAPPGSDEPGHRCIVFTSGSSGSPKAVIYSDGWLLNEALGARVALGLDGGDRVALVLPAAFAAGLTVFVMALLNGSTVCAYDPRLAGIRGLPGFLAQTGVSTLHTTPSLLRSLIGVLPPDGGLDTVRLVTTCGEAVHGRDIAALRRHLRPDAVYTSWSGSSETGHLAFHRIDPDSTLPDGIVPVGRPAANKLVRLLDANGNDVEAGTAGEVTVTSAYLSVGYLDDPASTNERFVALPDGRTRYHMGDLGRFDEDGTLHLLGRQDSALKIRGYLVEPAEVEGVLLTHPDIAEAVVIGLAQQGADDAAERPARLVAYVCPVSRERALSTTAIRRLLREKLPEWMVPSIIVQLPELARNERGKVDRAALQQPDLPPPPLPARTPWEAMLADIWAMVMDVDAVGRDSDFTELGGDSLDAEEMLAIVSDRLDVRLLTSDLAAAPTLADFAERTAALHASQSASRRRSSRARPPSCTLITLRSAEVGPVLFYPAGDGSEIALLAPLAHALGPAVPVVDVPLTVNSRPSRRMTLRTPRSSARAQHPFTVAIRSAQPRGPYALLAFGANADVARLAAKELALDGELVLLVAPDRSPSVAGGMSADQRGVTPVAIPTSWTTDPGATRAAASIRTELQALAADR